MTRDSDEDRDEGGEGHEKVDQRMAWLKSKVVAELSVTEKIWTAMLKVNTNKHAINSFLDEPPLRFVLFYKKEGALIASSSKHPTSASVQGNLLYFLKNDKVGAVDEKEIGTQLHCGGLGTPLNQLALVVKEVYMPIFRNPRNREHWPTAVAQEVVQHFYRMAGSVDVVVGLTEGKTVLPLPPDAADTAEADTDKALVHRLESAVIDWTNQVRSVVTSTCASTRKSKGGRPSPLEEIEFWGHKADMLRNTYTQLLDARMKKIGRILYLTQSSYHPAFENVVEETHAALLEACDIYKNLSPLMEYLDDMESTTDTVKLLELFDPILYLLTLAWGNSKNYLQVSHIVTLVEELNHSLITRVRENEVDGQILMLEPPEAVQHLKVGMHVVETFKVKFQEYQAQVERDRPDHCWHLDSEALFTELDAFAARLNGILPVVETIVDFRKLEKVEIGGYSGKRLTTQVQDIRQEFDDALQALSSVPYDISDINAPTYLRDVETFKRVIVQLEKRVISILSDGFKECANPLSALALFESFGGILFRPELVGPFGDIVKLNLKRYQADIETVSRVFKCEQDDPVILTNMPPVAGAITWARSLRLRIENPYERTMLLDESVSPSGEPSELAQEVKAKYDDLVELLKDYERSRHKVWAASIDVEAATKLSLPLLKRGSLVRDGEDDRLLGVNFDAALVVLLREVKHLQIMALEVPEAANGIYGEGEQFRQYVLTLDSMVARYNGIIKSLLPVERPLMKVRLDELDVLLERGLSTITWQSAEVVTYISSTTQAVDALSSILTTLKSNVNEINEMMHAWSAKPMIARRKDGNRQLNVAETNAYIKSRSLEIELQGKRIRDLVAQSREVLGNIDDAKAWHAYAQYISEIVLRNGLMASVECSLRNVCNNMDPKYLTKHELPPLFDIRLMLSDQAITFDPPLEAMNNVPDLRTIFQAMMDSCFQIGALVSPRIDGQQRGTSYHEDLLSDPTLLELRATIVERVDRGISDCRHNQETFLVYQDLWTTDRDEYMKSFLDHGKLLTLDEDDLAEQVDSLESHSPTLDDFAHQIQHQDKYAEAVRALSDSSPFHWLLVDFKPFKKALLGVIAKWRFMFTKHLHDEVVESMDELAKFITEADEGLSREVGEDDYELLVETMGLLRTIRDRLEFTDGMFDPLRETITLLKEFNVEMEQEVLEQLNDVPQEWTNLKRKMYTVKGALTPLQEREMSKIKARRDTFMKEVERFWADLQGRAPFSWSVDQDLVYDVLDDLNVGVVEKEVAQSELADREDMFELTVVQYKEITEGRKILWSLKKMWDLVHLVLYEFGEWKQTSWRVIDTELMMGESKQFLNAVKKLPRDCRAWGVYESLEGHIKNMMQSLGAITELRSMAMRDRHWRLLIRTTGVEVDIHGLETTVTLQNLLDLELHNHAEAVQNIVAQAVGELQVEKNVAELEKTWADMNLTFSTFKDTPLLDSNPDLMETLEDNMVSLQNMMSSKFVGHFLEKITEWQTRLSAVDTVIRLWLEVQHDWAHLEAIFKDSADIRQQLQEDSQRFDRLDKEWRSLMTDAVEVPNVVEACCNNDQLQPILQTLEKELAKCSKALDEYLETKRLIFPRFYFISKDDLLDILAKGEDPQNVLVHLFKLFDNLVNLAFEPNEDGTPSRKAVAMYSSEGERVELLTPCECKGQVEYWLNSLIESMRKSLRKWLGKAVDDYGETGREEWLLQYPAQIALTGSQIWWTTEVEQAFEKLEEGYETALKDYLKQSKAQLVNLVRMLQGELDKNSRRCIMTICTIDTHNRDVVRSLVEENAENASCFAWQSQLKLSWDDDKFDCFINICDAEFQYSYEYLGNAGRLVITPLTDRCYITLTQSLHLIMGGAPAGPAGTGKTETTKDLGRALGIRVLVQNCSPQQTYLDMAGIFKGLAQSGMWGCFDEFNRIKVAVLSVVATQVKSILDAIKAKKNTFSFMGEDIQLVNTVGMFITMNPGYAGRTELPDNLKALFRSVSMVVPDLERICEIMLMAEGFEAAEGLALKFTTLYALTKELLSKAMHYDWGLRAIKSVLVVAGMLKRAEPDIPEASILMRALRDFNLPKIVTEDVQIFLYLIEDLFPGTELDRKVNATLETAVKTETLAAGLQAEGQSFVLKVLQLDEILEVRHSVFIIGPSGSGKTEVWKMLARAYGRLGRKTTYKDINPKAVDTKELFGYKNPVTKEPMDGLFSKIMRDLAQTSGDLPKWIVLDGDIDPDWIESLNTVMDDNKVLTLPSNERIQLTSSMRLLFEIGNLKHATPATVSRAGILFINETDIGWQPYVQSWIERRGNMSEKSNLTVLFERYVPNCLEYIKKHFTSVIPVPDFQKVQSLCHMLEGLLTPENIPPGSERDGYEMYFVFAVVWAMGGSLIQDPVVDHRNDFSKWIKSEYRSVKFPSQGSVFDFTVGPDKKWQLWSETLPAYVHDPEIPLLTVKVETAETIRTKFWLELFVRTGRPVMLVGNTGVGKTRQVQSVLGDLPDKYMSCYINFNYYTDASTLQDIMENSPPLERQVGKDYGPPASKKLVYFVDDITMPQLDDYETQTPSTLLRQHIDYGHWYDRAKWEIKNIKRCQYIACLNPKMGSFNIDPRLQRHFTVFDVSMPSKDTLTYMYSSILNAHLASGFNASLPKVADKFVAAVLDLHSKVTTQFLPTAIKFHYQFNLRSLSLTFQGLLKSIPVTVTSVNDMAQLWVHESRRIYSDVLTSKQEIGDFDNVVTDVFRRTFPDLQKEEVFVEPLIFSNFSQGAGSDYTLASGFPSLRKILDEALRSYNDLNAAMDLVLFEDAMEHVSRISRIVSEPGGSALLIGVGGSGKQSLARLAASLSGFDVFQIQINRNYGVSDLKADLVKLYMRCGVRGDDMVFLLTDAQVIDERFLIYVNDLLSSGFIPGLFPTEEMDNIVASLRSEVKQMGIVDTKENVWEYFVDKARKHLHVVLCFSPVGDVLRGRYRKFPALVNNTQIDWFHPWPHEALVSVAHYFLQSVDLDQSKDAVVRFIAYIHGRVEEASIVYREQFRRHNYTTPKSFLELIKLYKALLDQERAKIKLETDRLESGLERLRGASDQVAALHQKLAIQQENLAKRTAVADELVKQLGKDQLKVQKESEMAMAEEEKTNVVKAMVEERKKECDKDLAAAEPAIMAAEAALSTFSKKDLAELKALNAPPSSVAMVLAAVMILQSPEGRIRRDVSWKAGKQYMQDITRFYDSLVHFDRDAIPLDNVRALKPYLSNKDFSQKAMVKKSVAAAGICAWVVNICKYHEVYLFVQPKREALAEATQELEDAEASLLAVQQKLEKLEATLQELTNKFEKARMDKEEMEREAATTELTIDLANRLVGGLGSEGKRWQAEVERLGASSATLVGDVLVAAGFISYIGSFNRSLREELVNDAWLPWLQENEVPLSKNYDTLDILTTEAGIAKWHNEGLPTDRVSLENAAVCTNCQRWPLLIDPQLQGSMWLRARTDFEQLKVTRLDNPKMLIIMEDAIRNGFAVLLEGVDETIDAVLDPLLGRNFINKGKSIKLGDKVVDYNPNFRLFIQCKLGNPHFKPELQALTTLINFTVTENGLEDQLLATVVKNERPDLEDQRSTLIRTLNEYQIKLKELEATLLQKLQEAEGDFLSDTVLVENLENTKATAMDITEKKRLAETTQQQIEASRNTYRPVATRAALLYFLLNDLSSIDHMYQFSLKAFVIVFVQAIKNTPVVEGGKDDDAESTEEVPSEEELTQRRVDDLIDAITYQTFLYTTRGLFERHKLTFTTMLCFRILQRSGLIAENELAYLLSGRKAGGSVTSPVDWASEDTWRSVVALKNLETYAKIAEDIEGSSARWRKWSEEAYPETATLPQDWKHKTDFQKLLVLRALRPDRIISGVTNFIATSPSLGPKYVDSVNFDIADTFTETTPDTHMFFILSPGVDPIKGVEAFGKRKGYTVDNRRFKNVSLGEGQEDIAMDCLDYGHKEGAWVILQNIHLMVDWLTLLEKKLDALSEGAHQDFRVFLSAEPSALANNQIPISILQRCIKVTNEPPRGMKANMRRALGTFTQDTLESCSKETEFHTILFTMCFFHAVVIERKKFGPAGWNGVYNFNTGDLTISIDVLGNYLENNSKIPWEDLRYMFGEIMYGGHISDDWDRRLCMTYLERYIQPELTEEEIELVANFSPPPHSNIEGYHEYITEQLPMEAPSMFGLGRNAEIGFLTSQTNTLFRTIMELQPQASSKSGAGASDDKVLSVMKQIMESLPTDELYSMMDLYSRTEDKRNDPYVVVALQECDRMNQLVAEVKRSLKELDLGIKGDLMMSEQMELLAADLASERVPESWTLLAYPSLKSLGLWVDDLLLRIKQLNKWVQEFRRPQVLWLSGLFNPQSYLTAIMQKTARKNQLPLDKMRLSTEVTKKDRADVHTAKADGDYITGLFLEGARWDTQSMSLAEAGPKELYSPLPVVYVKAVTSDKLDTRGQYRCPVYKTTQRGPHYVWTFNLRSKQEESKWILAGTAILLSC